VATTGVSTHRQEHGTRQLPLWPVGVSSRCLRLASAPPWEHLPEISKSRNLSTGPGDRWEIGPLAHTCASAVGVLVDPAVVGHDWSPVFSNKARGYCCRTTDRRPLTEPHCSRGVQPGGIYMHVVQREPTPGGPGSGLRPGRKRFPCQPPLWFYIYIYILQPRLTISPGIWF
jgi:hypothetical protein